MTIAYIPKQNQRPLGQELVITNEAHFIGQVGTFTSATGKVKLVEVPFREVPSSISIPGYTEVTTSPGPLEFTVDYANGWLTFNTSQDGIGILVSYKGRGSEVDAVDVNELQTPVGVALQSNGELTNGHVKPAGISINPADNFVFPNDVQVTNDLEVLGDTLLQGDLTVNGTTTSVNTVNLTVEDAIITLAFGTPGIPTLDSGIEVDRGTYPDVKMVWKEDITAWTFRDTSDNAILTAYDTGDVEVAGALIVGSIKTDEVLSDTSLTFGIDEDNDSTTELFLWRINGVTEVMRLNEDGNLGIGATTIYARLQAEGATTAFTSDSGLISAQITGTLKRVNLGYDTGADIGYIQAVDSGTTNKTLCLNADGGNVGVGVSVASSTLTVGGTIEATAGDIYLSRTSTAFGYITRPNSVGFKKLGLSVTGGGALEEVQVNSNITHFTGYVGIGTNTPSRQLEVSDNSDPRILIRHSVETIANTVYLQFLTGVGGPSTTNTLASVRAIITDADPNPLKADLALYTNAGDAPSEKVRVKSSGEVGIGTTDPKATLHNAGSNVHGMDTAADPGSITLAQVDNYSGVVISTTIAATVTLPTPTNNVAGRHFHIIHEAGSTGTLSVNSFSLKVGGHTSFVWSGTAWTLITAPATINVVVSDPGSPTVGDIWFNTTDLQFKGYNGSSIILLG